MKRVLHKIQIVVLSSLLIAAFSKRSQSLIDDSSVLKIKQSPMPPDSLQLDSLNKFGFR